MAGLCWHHLQLWQCCACLITLVIISLPPTNMQLHQGAAGKTCMHTSRSWPMRHHPRGGNLLMEGAKAGKQIINKQTARLANCDIAAISSIILMAELGCLPR